MLSRIKVFTLSVIVLMMVTLTGCFGGSSTESRSLDSNGNAPITSDWEYYSLKTESDTYYRTALDSEDDLPFFRSSDGETCEIALVKGKSYKAYITDLGGGRYKISKVGSDTALDVQIEGTAMKITFPGGKIVTFVVK